MLKRLSLLLVAAITQSCATLQSRPFSQPIVETKASVTRGAEWQVSYVFDQNEAVWFFPSSWTAEEDSRSWRVGSWRVMTPGVRLERIGNFDALTSATGKLPRSVTLAFTPYTKGVHNDYNPAIFFSDGSVAIFAQHFEVQSAATLQEVEALPAELPSDRTRSAKTTIEFSDAEAQIYRNGTRHRSIALQNNMSYVMFSRTEPVSSEALTAFLDPGLPAWIRQSLVTAVPATFARYAKLFGPPPAGKPSLIAGWGGPLKGSQNFAGHTLPGQIIMHFEGEGLLEESKRAKTRYAWLAAHEGAHFWLGQTIRYASVRDSWITEGGAELLALRSLKAQDPSFDLEGEIASNVTECAKLTKRGGVETAYERNDFRAYYACGVVLGRFAELHTGKPFESFVQKLLAANRHDGVVDRADWEAQLGPAVPATARQGITALLKGGVADPASLLARLLAHDS